MEDRMTLCNVVVEAGGKNGVVPIDSTTYKYLKIFEGISVRCFDVSKVEPLVSKPHSSYKRALSKECKDVKNGRVYIGSCTGGKTDNFLSIAKVLLAVVRRYCFCASLVAYSIDTILHYFEYANPKLPFFVLEDPLQDGI